MTQNEAGTEHRVVGTDLLNSLTGAVWLTCSCGWSAHGTRWRELAHGADIPPLPQPEPQRISREELRRAIYGERRSFNPYR